jgi:hypothetical protein
MLEEITDVRIDPAFLLCNRYSIEHHPLRYHDSIIVKRRRS